MIEDWQIVYMMTKAKEIDLLARVESDKKRISNKKKHTYPLYYFTFQKIGKLMIKFGSDIENRFKTSNYSLDIVRLDA